MQDNEIIYIMALLTFAVSFVIGIISNAMFTNSYVHLATIWIGTIIAIGFIMVTTVSTYLERKRTVSTVLLLIIAFNTCTSMAAFTALLSGFIPIESGIQIPVIIALVVSFTLTVLISREIN